MKGNEDEENSEDKLVEEIVKDVVEEEDMDEDSHVGFLNSDKSDSNDPDIDTKA